MHGASIVVLVFAVVGKAGIFGRLGWSGRLQAASWKQAERRQYGQGLGHELLKLGTSCWNFSERTFS